MEYLIVMPLALIAGFVDSIAGGGGLISLPAYIFAGLPAHVAIGTNKFSSTLGTLVATIRYALFGYMIPCYVIIGVVCGLVGSTLGAYLTLLIDSTALMIFMLFSLPIIAFLVFRVKDLDAFAQRAHSRRFTLLLTAAFALAIGTYDGFYGPGTGTFLMLALTSGAHQGMNQAAGTTKAINLSTNAAALVVFLVNGVVLIPLGLAAGACNIVGNWIGASFFNKKGARVVRPIMLIVIVLFAIRLITDLVSAYAS